MHDDMHLRCMYGMKGKEEQKQNLVGEISNAHEICT